MAQTVENHEIVWPGTSWPSKHEIRGITFFWGAEKYGTSGSKPWCQKTIELVLFRKETILVMDLTQIQHQGTGRDHAEEVTSISLNVPDLQPQPQLPKISDKWNTLQTSTILGTTCRRTKLISHLVMASHDVLPLCQGMERLSKCDLSTALGGPVSWRSLSERKPSRHELWTFHASVDF